MTPIGQSHKLSNHLCRQAAWPYRLERLIGEHELLVPQALRASLHSRSDVNYFVVYFIADVIDAGLQAQDFSLRVTVLPIDSFIAEDLLACRGTIKFSR